eukprot:1289203-Amphidinium_carterae.1
MQNQPSLHLHSIEKNRIAEATEALTLFFKRQMTSALSNGDANKTIKATSIQEFLAFRVM